MAKSKEQKEYEEAIKKLDKEFEEIKKEIEKKGNK